MSKAKKVDKNQKEIVKQLRSLGYSVELTYMIGKGFPDFIIGFDKWFTLPVELKSGKGKLTEDETQFHKRYKGYVIIAYTLDDILKGLKEFNEQVKNVRCNATMEN